MAATKKSATKKAALKKPAGTSKGEAKVHKVMKEYKEGDLKSSSGDKVTDRKQAIAIALSEAREAGADVPPPPKKAVSKSAKK